MAIVVLVLWLATAGAGLTLLRTGGATRQARARDVMPEPALPEPALAEPALAEQLLAGPELADPVLADASPGDTAVARRVRTGAVPLRPDGRPPRGPHVRVATPTGEHPLLEFSHPALAVAGIACWMMFTFVHYRPMAWIAFGILVATVLLGAGWLLRNRQAARQGATVVWSFPPRLVLAHGLIAGLSIVLTVLTALTAGRA